VKHIALDTNAYSALAGGSEKVAKLVRKAISIGVPITVLGELYFGITDGKNTADNTEHLEKFLNTQRVQILHIDEETARIFGEIATELKRAGKPIQQNDIWIAALCKQHSYSLVSNDRGFSNIIGLGLLSF